MKLSGLGVATFFLATEVLLACPVCGSTDPVSGRAFLISTGILSLLPLSMFGGIILYIRKKKKSA